MLVRVIGDHLLVRGDGGALAKLLVRVIGDHLVGIMLKIANAAREVLLKIKYSVNTSLLTARSTHMLHCSSRARCAVETDAGPKCWRPSLYIYVELDCKLYMYC